MFKQMFVKTPTALAALLVCLFAAPVCHAHPMGNFSVNHYSKITLSEKGIELRYILDLAEIPAYQLVQQANIVSDASDPRVATFLLAEGKEIGRGLSLLLDGTALPLRLVSKDILFPPGAGGLPTMKMGFVFEAAYPVDKRGHTSELQFEDKNFAGHTGWKEIVVRSHDVDTISTTAPANDRSSELSNYPTDLLNSPPQDLAASIRFALPAAAERTTTTRENNDAVSGSYKEGKTVRARAATSNAHRLSANVTRTSNAATVPLASPSSPLPAIHLNANQQTTPRSSFTQLIASGGIGFWFLFTAALIAFGLGALHALEPGHGKTIVAAYLVGSRGTVGHAALLGVIVTTSHTAGVFLLGAITLYASRYIVPEQLYPWMGVMSGATIAGLGGYIFLRRWAGQDAEHSHADGKPHSHWFAAKKRASEDTPTLSVVSADQRQARSVSLSQLFILGITGGIIPCPAALVVLLSALALHRVMLGLFLIIAFSLGLAAVLIAFGMLMVYARAFMTRLKIDGPFTTRYLPVVSAAFMTILGLGITAKALATTGLHFGFASRANLGPFLFISGLGLVLGMRHSTDPDHVVAVSTIVSKQRSIRHAALIGTFWGLGHTLTIFVVGCLIILFGVVIPPRVGLSMEFSVAIMLVVLGLLNLSGLMRKITQRVSSKRGAGERFTDSAEPGATRKAEALLDRAVGRLGVYQCVRPLVIGIVHGLAGSAAVALLVLSTIHSPMWATAYLVVFGAGTMIGMMCMTTAMAVPLAYAGNRFAQVSRYLGVASGLVSLCFGAFLVYHLGFADGLFTGHPLWTPQ